MSTIIVQSTIGSHDSFPPDFVILPQFSFVYFFSSRKSLASTDPRPTPKTTNHSLDQVTSWPHFLNPHNHRLSCVSELWSLLIRYNCRLRLKCDATRAETRPRLSTKRTSPYKSAGASVQSTTGSRDVCISGSNIGYTMFRGSVKSTGYPLHSPVSPTLLLLCITVCHHISTGLYHTIQNLRLLHMIQHLSNDLS